MAFLLYFFKTKGKNKRTSIGHTQWVRGSGLQEPHGGPICRCVDCEGESQIDGEKMEHVLQHRTCCAAIWLKSLRLTTTEGRALT
jgi:hypothetical protein